VLPSLSKPTLPNAREIFRKSSKRALPLNPPTTAPSLPLKARSWLSFTPLYVLARVTKQLHDDALPVLLQKTARASPAITPSQHLFLKLLCHLRYRIAPQLAAACRLSFLISIDLFTKWRAVAAS